MDYFGGIGCCSFSVLGSFLSSKKTHELEIWSVPYALTKVNSVWVQITKNHQLL